ncbi:hypothetical protein EDD85DRAFT_849564, partial [Armillaria nabsnona]
MGPASRTCIAKNTAENALNCITTFVTDFVLLLSMLSGILRTKNDQSLWRLLYRQVCDSNSRTPFMFTSESRESCGQPSLQLQKFRH